MPSPLRVRYNPRRPLKQTNKDMGHDMREGGRAHLSFPLALPLTFSGPYAILFLEKVREVRGIWDSTLFRPKYFPGIHRTSPSSFKYAPSSALRFLSSSPHSGRPLTSFHPILAFSCIHGRGRDGPTLLIDRSIHHSYPLLSFLPSPSPCLCLATPFSVSCSELRRFY